MYLKKDEGGGGGKEKKTKKENRRSGWGEEQGVAKDEIGEEDFDDVFCLSIVLHDIPHP